jgi:hypothetical protein
MALLRFSVLRGEETHFHVSCIRRRRRDLAAKFQPLAESENATGRQRGPSVDFRSGGVSVPIAVIDSEASAPKSLLAACIGAGCVSASAAALSTKAVTSGALFGLPAN